MLFTYFSMSIYLSKYGFAFTNRCIQRFLSKCLVVSDRPLVTRSLVYSNLYLNSSMFV